MTKSISIFGLGYVGSVTAACFASKGFKVVGIDSNPQKVEALNAGRSPIVEPGLDELVMTAHKAGLLRATTDAMAAAAETDISFISVGTPSQRNGKLDLSHIAGVCEDIGRAIRSKKTHHTVVVRSTVLPGTTEDFVAPAIAKASGKTVGKDFSICFNPEFLREGSAVEDFFQPEITVLGAPDEAARDILASLYTWAPGKIFRTATRDAEMVKYVCNAFHALKVAFANEVGTICNELNVDHDVVTKIYTSDTRLNISTVYLKPGFAFGGSCLPKDLKAMTYRAKELDLKVPLFNSIMESNHEHIERAVESVLRTGKRKVGILGLSFKPGTDDLRESPMVYLVKRLLGEGCQIEIWDKHVSLGQLIGSNRQFIVDTIPHIGSLLSEDLRQVMSNADVLVVGSKALMKEHPDLLNSKIVINVDALAKPKAPVAVAAHA